MHNIAVKKQNCPRGPLGGDYSSQSRQARHVRFFGLIAERSRNMSQPCSISTIAGMCFILIMTAGSMRAWNEIHRSIEFGDIVQKNCDCKSSRCRHLVLLRPKAIILMPRPKVTVKCGLQIHFELVDVSPILENLFDRAEHGVQSRETIKHDVFLKAAMKRTPGLPVLLKCDSIAAAS